MPLSETSGLPTGGSASWHIGFRMDVVGADGNRVGEVTFVGDSDFLVDRPLARDIYVPYGACQSVEPHRVILRVPAGEVDNQGWAYSELGETPSV
jgi:hypothetical protein